MHNANCYNGVKGLLLIYIIWGLAMDLKQLGRTNVKVPAIGMGTWEIGGQVSRDSSRDEEGIRAIRKAVELGMYLIDTAEIYAAGHCEEIVGEAIKCLPREKVFIVSKVWHNHLHYDDLILSAETSLKRLQIDFIDLYLIHWPNPRVPLKETMVAMEELAKRRLVRFIGVSNFDVSQLEKARSFLTENEIAANEVDYSLLVRGREKDVIPYCQDHQITVMAYRPLARGSLAQNKFLQEIGQKYNKSATQVALNWIITKEHVIAIPKALNPDHLRENAEAAGWHLSKKDVEGISHHFHKYLIEYGLKENFSEARDCT